jgi:predicted SAM-dependent methyltransferase
LKACIRRFLLFLFSHRFLAIARWEFHFLKIRFFNATTFQSVRIRRFVASCKTPVLLNLGSGPRGVGDSHWINVDGFRDRNVHYVLDISRRLPFGSNSFDGVFCEHVLEHFSLEDGERIAREVCRILRPGGSVRIIVPDAELLLQRYFSAPGEIVAWRGAGHETPMQVVNSYFRQRYEHQFLYDWVTMERMLRRAGFGQVARTSVGSAVYCSAIVLDAAKYEWESLYVVASKG